VAALIVLGVANTMPLMGLSVVGRHTSTTILGGAWQMWVQGEGLTALVVAFCAAVAPAGYLLCLLTVLLMVRHPPASRRLCTLLRWADSLQPWAMVEVMMLGILVALVKIADLAAVEAGIALYAVGVLLVLFPAIAVSLDRETLWGHITWTGDPDPAADMDCTAP
jgi:paraquat-inducible protein A